MEKQINNIERYERIVLVNSEIDNALWRDFVNNHPQGNVFQTPEMYNLYSQTSRNDPMVIAVVDKTPNGNIIIRGIMLAVIISNGISLFKPFTARSIIIGGPLVDERQDSDAIWNLLIEEYNNRLRWYVIYTEIRPLFDMSMNASRLKALGFEKRGHYNLLLDIGLGKEQVWVNMHKKRRKNIKHAINAGLSFQEVFNDEEIMKCVKLLQQTYVRKRVPLSDIELFTNAKFCLGENAHWFGAYYEGQMIACKLSLSYKNLIIAWYGGSDDAYFKQCPNDFLTWEVLCWSIDNGYTSYDFGGGGEPGIAYGVRDYKLKFGCKIYDFGRYLLFHKPLLYKLADFFVKLLKIKKS